MADSIPFGEHLNAEFDAFAAEVEAASDRLTHLMAEARRLEAEYTNVADPFTAGRLQLVLAEVNAIVDQFERWGIELGLGLG